MRMIWLNDKDGATFPSSTVDPIGFLGASYEDRRLTGGGRQHYDSLSASTVSGRSSIRADYSGGTGSFFVVRTANP